MLRFGDKDWRHQLNKAARDWKFQATLKPRIDRAVEEWHDTQPPTIPSPIVDFDNLHIKAPWTNDESSRSSD